jgi:hypothetical protein
VKLKFLCGCEHEFDPLNQPLAEIEYEMELEADEIPVNFAPESLPRDEQGFLLCPQHRVRRAGWRSAGQKRFGWGLTPLQLEQALTGVLVDEGNPVKVHAPSVPDIRDNRDPRYMVEFARRELRDLRDSRRVLISSDDWDAEQIERDVDSVRFALASHAARERLDLQDRTGWPVQHANREARRER